MPASKHGEVQTNKTDGRKFITLKVGSNGQVAYRRVYLRTKDPKVARGRARALEGVSDLDQARRLIAFLGASRTAHEEQRRIAELTGDSPLLPSVTQEFARQELESIVCDLGDCAPGEVPDEIVDRWMQANSPNQWRRILIALGVPRDWLEECPDIYTQIKPRGVTINPNHRPISAACSSLFGLDEKSMPDHPPARGPRLSVCIHEFRQEQEQRGNTAKHIAACINHFRTFVSYLKDKHLLTLTKTDFVRFADHVIRA
jgi:hypothetical protein